MSVKLPANTKYSSRICLLHLGKCTKFVGTIILLPSNITLWRRSVLLRLLGVPISSPLGWEFVPTTSRSDRPSESRGHNSVKLRQPGKKKIKDF